MTDVKGVNYTLTTNTPAEQVGGNQWSVCNRTFDDTYEAAAAAAGTDVLVARVRPGGRVGPGSRVFHDALGAGVTLSLVARAVSDGTETVLIAAASASSAGILAFAAADIAAAGLEIDELSDIIVKIAGGAATGTIKSFFSYTVQ